MDGRRFAVEMMRAVSVSLACAAMGAGANAQAPLPSPLPSHGPAKGYLVITGGGPDYKTFLALAGGKNAHIVVIPTAAIMRQEDEKMLPPYCNAGGPFAGMKCTVLHTTDRKVADSPEFVAPLKDATGVYLEGGRHWRLADAYLGTLTLKEMFGVLDRGGVIMGGSAGATIQGSYMVRGSSNPDDNTIMMAPGHEVGFAFFTNVTIDQHVDTRQRENDLAPVMKAHPQLLGLGLDQSTSITVHGDTLTVNGPKRVAVWDGKDHDGKGYYYLRTGDTLNTATRVATVVAHAADPKDNPITLPPEKLARYVGVYQPPGAQIMTITLENGQLISQLTGQPKVPLFALEDGKFFPRVVDADLDFTKDADGNVTLLTLHQNGHDVSMPRLSEADAKRATAENAAREALTAKRVTDQKPAEGSEAAIRKNIADVSAGTPDYNTMSKGLAEATRQQLDGVKALFASMGAVKSVTFKTVEQSGADVYVVEFEHGSTEWRIILGPDGKIDMLGFRPI
jgi:cyanophycinase